MKVLSLFSGVGGFDLGLEAAGMETVALCEWDKKAASVLRRHWPHIPIYGDVSDLTGTQLLADGVHPDLVAFGSPCQDLSVAGKRAGLAGERSGLFHEAVRIIRELRELTDGALPRWVIWENVVGALNSNGGADFGAVLNEMGNLGSVFSEWAVLDAQNFGVAQRRRRVFLVSCLDPGAARGCPDPLLPVREGGPRDLVPLREAWKNSAGSSPGGARDRDIVVLRQREGKPGGGKGPLLAEQSLTLATGNDQTVFQPVEEAFIFQQNQRDEVRIMPGVAGSLMSSHGMKNANFVGQPVGFSHTQGLDAQPSEDHFPTLRREGGGHAVAQPFTKAKRAQSETDDETWVDGEVAPTLSLMDNTGGVRATVLGVYRRSSAVAQMPVAEVAGTLTGGAHPGGFNGQDAYTGQLIVAPYAVRRLLPIECERLMGWPDDWTRWDADGKEQADSHRYKQTGNGVASPVAEWVGRHIFAQDAIGRSLK